jgi:hypothetical protein
MSSPNAIVAAVTGVPRKKARKTVFPKVDREKFRRVKDPVFNLGSGPFLSGCALIEARATYLNLGKRSEPIRFVGSDQNSTIVGDLSQQTATLERYLSTARGFINFCIITRDYQSAILLHTAGCTTNPCPPFECSVINYTRYRVMLPTETLIDAGTGNPLLIDECPMKCLGDWRSKETVGVFRSTINFLSNRYRDCKGVYEPVCDMCLAMGPDSPVGCDRRNHNNAPVKRFPRGNVTTSSQVVTSFKNMEDYVDTHYIVRSTIAFLPSELRKMRARCLSGNELGELMIWVILLTST